MSLTKLLKLDDSLFNLYTIIMFLMFFAPSLFFTSHFDFYTKWVLMYLVAVLFAYPYLKHKRIDVSSSLVRWVSVGLICSLGFWLFLPNIASPLYARNFITALIWYVFVVGLSETYIQLGLEAKLQNRFIVVVFMGLLHSTAYMMMLGDYSITWFLIWNLFKASCGFWLFFIVNDYFKDPFVSALVHGLYDYFLMY